VPTCRQEMAQRLQRNLDHQAQYGTGLFAEKIGMQRSSEFTRTGHRYWRYAIVGPGVSPCSGP